MVLGLGKKAGRPHCFTGSSDTKILMAPILNKFIYGVSKKNFSIPVSNDVPKQEFLLTSTIIFINTYNNF